MVKCVKIIVIFIFFHVNQNYLTKLTGTQVGGHNSNSASILAISKSTGLSISISAYLGISTNAHLKCKLVAIWDNC